MLVCIGCFADALGMATRLSGSGTSYSDGVGTSAKFHYPFDVVINSVGTMYVADTYNHLIRKITGNAWTVFTIFLFASIL